MDNPRIGQIVADFNSLILRTIWFPFGVVAPYVLFEICNLERVGAAPRQLSLLPRPMKLKTRMNSVQHAITALQP